MSRGFSSSPAAYRVGSPTRPARFRISKARGLATVVARVQFGNRGWTSGYGSVPSTDPEPRRMNCQTFRAQHVVFVDLALPDEAYDAMMQHREVCDPCDRFDNAVRRGLLMVRNLPNVRPSAAFGSRLEAKLRVAHLAETESQRANLLNRPATVRTMMMVAASLLGMIYLVETGARGSARSELATGSRADLRDVARAPEGPRPMLRIYSAPLRSPAVVTVVSMASNAEWMSPIPSVPAPSAFAPAMLETAAFVR